MSSKSSEWKKGLIESLRKIGVVNFGSFKLKDGSVSPVYVDLRILPNFPDVFIQTIRFAAQFLKNTGLEKAIDGLTAPPLAGVPLGAVLAIELNKPFFIARITPKNHGTKKIIEGDVFGKRILIVDDVITSGDSKIPFINSIVDNGGLVENIFVFVNRMRSVDDLKQFKAKNGVEVFSLLTLEDLY